MNRVSMMGELAASLTHEIMHPIGSARNYARAAQNFLDMQPPGLDTNGGCHLSQLVPSSSSSSVQCHLAWPF
jgi:hypothetical protein